jgi:Sec7 domain
MNKSSPLTHHEPLPPLPLPTLLTPLPQPNHQIASNHQLSDLRHTIENFGLPNGSNRPFESSVPPSGRVSQTSPRQHQTPEVRIYDDGEIPRSRDPRFESDASQAAELIRITSSHISDSSRVVGKSSPQDKAKQIMGLNGKKSLSSAHRKLVADDGNITALETEFSDVITPQKRAFEKEDMVRENGESVEVDRVKETARDIYNGTELLVSLGDAARWLMNSNEFNSKVRKAYLELFDFMGLDILTAVRFVFI